MIGLPERSDKRDALTLMASLTGFSLTWVDGVPGKSISDKALPFVSFELHRIQSSRQAD